MDPSIDQSFLHQLIYLCLASISHHPPIHPPVPSPMGHPVHPSIHTSILHPTSIWWDITCIACMEKCSNHCSKTKSGNEASKWKVFSCESVPQNVTVFSTLFPIYKMFSSCFVYITDSLLHKHFSCVWCIEVVRLPLQQFVKLYVCRENTGIQKKWYAHLYLVLLSSNICVVINITCTNWKNVHLHVHVK